MAEKLQTTMYTLPLVFVIVSFLLAPASSEASRISLEVSQEIQESSGQVRAHLRVLNKGDEAAHDLQIKLEAIGKETSSATLKKLEPSGAWEQDIPFLDPASRASLPSGRYPVVVSIFYSDANGHPFSALSVSLFDTDEGAPNDLSGTLKVWPVADRGSFKLDLHNMGKAPVDATVRLLFPREVSLDREVETITINDKSSTTLKGSIKNLSAVPGSSYPVCAVIEYDKDGRHFASTVGATMEVNEAKGLVRSWRIALLVVLALLVLLMVVRQVTRRQSLGTPRRT